VVEEALLGGVASAPHPVREPPRPRFSGGVLARIWQSEGGTAVVEFSLVLLPLCLIVFGILDFGRALNYYNDLTHMAGQGARAAAVNQDPLGGAASANFQHQLACGATSGELRGGINVRIATTPTNVGDPVTITTSYRFHFVPLLRLGLTLSAAQTERYEAGVAPTYAAANDVVGPPGPGACP
jgi:Flp pilus assembly protein TadG